jgi:hypothetical protein
MTSNLTHLRICVEKPLIDEEHVMKSLSDKSNSYHHFKKLSAAFLTQKMWPKDTTIKISFVSSENTIKNVDWTPISVLKDKKNSDGSHMKLDPIEEEIRKLSPIEAVKKVVRERIQPIVGLKFIFVAHSGHVRIGFNPHGGSYSLVGTDCVKSKERVTMNFGWLDAGTIIHEFGHVLGMVHEHINPMGKTIPWDDSKVYDWAKQTQKWNHPTTYHNIIERYKTDQINSSKYDKYSVMKYFYPSSLTTDHKGVSINHILSREDIKYISNVYPGGRHEPSEFYMNIYGSSIDTPPSPNSKPFNWKIILYIIAGIIGFLLIIWISKSKKSKKSGSVSTYAAWRKSNGASPQKFTQQRYYDVR